MVQKLHICEKCILISFWIFEYCFYYAFIHYYCAIFYSLDAGFISIIQVSNSLDRDQARHFVGPDLGPNCLQRLSADIAGKELNTKQLVDAFWLKPGLKLIFFQVV